VTHKFDLDTRLERKDDETWLGATNPELVGRTRTARAALAIAGSSSPRRANSPCLWVANATRVASPVGCRI